MARKRSRSSPRSSSDKDEKKKLTKKQKLERRRAKLKAWREKKKEETETKMTLSTSRSSEPYVIFFIKNSQRTCVQKEYLSSNSLINVSKCISNLVTHLPIHFTHAGPFSRRSLPRRWRRKMRSWRRRRKTRWIRWRLT